jgi:hypothetical protein
LVAGPQWRLGWGGRNMVLVSLDLAGGETFGALGRDF